MQINTFIDNYHRRYSARAWTFEHLFCICVYFVIFSLPFYFSFASKNFWLDEQYGKMQVNYYYTGYYAVQINYLNSGNTLTQQLAVIPSSTMSQLNKLSVSVNDNATNAVFSFQLNGFSQQIISTNILIYYDVQIPALQKVASASYALSIANDFHNIGVSSVMNIQVTQPFNALTSSKAPTINRPAYFDTNFKAPTSFSDLIDAHLDNNYKLQSEQYIQSNAIPTATPTVRTLTLNLLKNTQAVIPYYPSILQTFKLKYSTYFGLLLFSYLIFKNLLLILIKNQALQCNQKDQIPNNALFKRNY